MTSLAALRVPLAVLAAVAVLGGLHLSESATLPLAFGAVLALFFRPLQRRLEKRLPRWASVTVVVLAFLLFLAAILAGIAYAANAVAQDLPRYAERLRGYGLRLPEDLTSGGGSSGGQLLGTVFRGVGAVLSPLSLVGLLVVFLALMLAEADAWRRRLVRALGPDAGGRVADAVRRMSGQFETFMWVQAATGLLTAALTWGACVLLGVPFPFVWAVLTFVLEFFPTIGSILAVVPPVLAAFALVGPGAGSLLLLILVVLQIGIGSLLNPKWQGDALKLSPTVVAFAVVFWGWLWGVGGAIIAVPLTAGLALVLAAFDATRPLAVLLGHADDDDDPGEAHRA